MGRGFVHLEEQAAANRTKSGCSLGSNLWAYPYGTFYDVDRERSASPSIEGHDIIVYVYTERTARTIGSLEGLFVSEVPIFIDSGGNIPCRRVQMPDFEKKYKGRFVPFEDK